MPSPGAPAPPRTSLEDSYLELLTDTLESLDVPLADNFFSAISARSRIWTYAKTFVCSCGTRCSFAVENSANR